MCCTCGPERWLPVVGHDHYEVSNHGRVRNAATGRVLRPQLMGKGYLKVHLGRSVQVGVHRLVCEAFVGPPPMPTYHADHGDFDPTNNHACNLRWLSPTENMGRQVRYGAEGWQRVGDEPAPDGWHEPSEAEARELAENLSAAGW